MDELVLMTSRLDYCDALLAVDPRWTSYS